MRYREPRRPCDFPVQIEWPSPDGPEVTRVMLRDLTAAGGRIRGLPPLGRGTPVSILLRDSALPGTVRWSGDGATGIRFDRPLTPRQMTLLRRQDRVGPAQAQRHVHGFREMR